MTTDLAMQGCCPTPFIPDATPPGLSDRWARALDDGRHHVDFLAPDVHCATCISTIEGALRAQSGVLTARVNLSTRRVAVDYDPTRVNVATLAGVIASTGYAVRPYDAAALRDVTSDAQSRHLLAAMAVAGFSAANIMLLSISVWSGAVDATRDLMHWVSALIAIPTVAFSGQVFFRSAWAGLRARRMNMDLPISVAVLLAVGYSLYETAHSAPHAWFDAAVSLLFFLLIGRYLDHRTRRLARSAAAELTALSATGARRMDGQGQAHWVPIDSIAPGDVIEVLPGERIPVDGVVTEGRSDIDRSLVTGESAPETASPGTLLHAGMNNLTGPLRLSVSATGDATLLADIARMVAAAENSQHRYVQLADRVARFYSPIVHLLALISALVWLWLTGGDGHRAVQIASAVLIITCPCALALAVPTVQAVASSVLFARGIMIKDGAALEKLAEVDHVVFDKTGTLTTGRAQLTDAPPRDDTAWPVALALAAKSRHPLAQSLLAVGGAMAKLDDIQEHAGLGLSAMSSRGLVRMGSAAYLGMTDAQGMSIWVDPADGRGPRVFRFVDTLRSDAAAVVAALRARGLHISLFSGDAPQAVAKVASDLGIVDARPRMTPADKAAALAELAAQGRKVLMVGDGLNDAPALAAAWVAMSPASASDVSRAAAPLVWVAQGLAPVALALRIAGRARMLMRGNLQLTAVYNALAVPIAALGMVTPLIAALAMSGSSILVSLNALRLKWEARA